MAEIVNLRRARKTKQRALDAKDAQNNRVQHGVAKSVRDLAQTRSAKEKRKIDSHKMDDDK